MCNATELWTKKRPIHTFLPASLKDCWCFRVIFLRYPKHFGIGVPSTLIFPFFYNGLPHHLSKPTEPNRMPQTPLVSDCVNKCLAIYGTPVSTACYKSSPQFSVFSCVNLILIPTDFPDCLLAFSLRLGLPNDLFTSSLLTNILHTFLITCYACYIPRQSLRFSLCPNSRWCTFDQLTKFLHVKFHPSPCDLQYSLQPNTHYGTVHLDQPLAFS